MSISLDGFIRIKDTFINTKYIKEIKLVRQIFSNHIKITINNYAIDDKNSDKIIRLYKEDRGYPSFIKLFQ